MNTSVVGWGLVLGLGLGAAGCAHHGQRPHSTISFIGNADPNKVPTDPADDHLGFVRVYDKAAMLNHTAAAWANENRYGQPNMAGPNAAARAKAERLARAELATCDRTVYFESGSAVLSPTSENKLRQVALCMSKAGGRATIVGRTDPQGGSAENLSLGAARANAVAAYLESIGVSPSEVGRVSLGDSGSTARVEAWPAERQAHVGVTSRRGN
ncbi:MAG: OmpA family protein [Myxococcales bacterium]